MPTRTRTRAKPAEENKELDFDPNAIADGGNPEPEFYDSGDDGQPGPADGGDDGSEDETSDPSATNQLGNTRAGMTQGQQAAQAELRDYMRRMQNLAEEKQGIVDDMKELKKEIKGKGYDTKAFDLIMKIDGLSDSAKQARRAQNGINATYAHAVGLDEDLL